MKWTPAVLLRVLVDLIVMNLAFILGAVLQSLLSGADQGGLGHESVLAFWHHAAFYWGWILALSILTVCVFTLNGFYTRGRFYQSRYKAVVVFQAVTLVYLLLAATNYLVGGSLARTTFMSAWMISLLAVEGSRLWSVVWRRVVVAVEHDRHPVVFDEKRVLVIGGAGYIGSALLPKLLEKGYFVRLLDLFVYGEESIEQYRDHPHLEIIKADFRQIDKVVEALRGMGSVIHLGAIVGDPACAIDEHFTVEVNLLATRMIAEACKGYGIQRFIFASTCSVYGASDEFLNEKSKLNPVSLYARTKIACEQVLLSMANDRFSPVILRFSTIYGLSGRTRFDLVVNLLTAKAKFDKKITLYGGDQWRPFLHVDDAALSVFKALEAPIHQVKDQVFNVGSEHQNHTLGQVAELIQAQVPDAEILELGQDGDRRNYRVDFTKIRLLLRFEPHWDLPAGIAQVVTAIDEGKVSNYTDGRFNNAKYLTELGETTLVRRHIDRVRDLIGESEQASA